MSFIQFARAHGVEIDPARRYPGEKIKRCGTVEKPRSRNGAYFWDGQRGWVFNWSAEAQVQWFNDPSAAPWTQAEKDAWKAQRQAQRAQQAQTHQRAAQQAQTMLEAATPGEHSYLHSKGFPLAQGLIAPDGALLIPMRNHQTQALQGVQVGVQQAVEIGLSRQVIEVTGSEAGRGAEAEQAFGHRAVGRAQRTPEPCVMPRICIFSSSGLSDDASASSRLMLPAWNRNSASRAATASVA